MQTKCVKMPPDLPVMLLMRAFKIPHFADLYPFSIGSPYLNDIGPRARRGLALLAASHGRRYIHRHLFAFVQA